MFVVFCDFFISITRSDPKNNNKIGKDGVDDELRNKLMTVYTSIYAMRKEIDGMKKPFGTKANPARSCRDIYYAHPTFDDGIGIGI